MAKEFGKDEIKEEAIPSAIKVKDEILNVRSSAIISLSEIIFKRRRKRKTDKEETAFRANVIAYYSLLREKFKKKDKIMELDEVITKKKKIPFERLYAHFCTLQHKVESLRITKIERRVVSDDRKLA